MSQFFDEGEGEEPDAYVIHDLADVPSSAARDNKNLRQHDREPGSIAINRDEYLEFLQFKRAAPTQKSKAQPTNDKVEEFMKKKQECLRLMSDSNDATKSQTNLFRPQLEKLTSILSEVSIAMNNKYDEILSNFEITEVALLAYHSPNTPNSHKSLDASIINMIDNNINQLNDHCNDVKQFQSQTIKYLATVISTLNKASQNGKWTDLHLNDQNVNIVNHSNQLNQYQVNDEKSDESKQQAQNPQVAQAPQKAKERPKKRQKKNSKKAAQDHRAQMILKCYKGTMATKNGLSEETLAKLLSVKLTVEKTFIAKCKHARRMKSASKQPGGAAIMAEQSISQLRKCVVLTENELQTIETQAQVQAEQVVQEVKSGQRSPELFEVKTDGENTIILLKHLP